MKECKHKNIVAYFGSYHRCCVFSACPLHAWNSQHCWWTEIFGIRLFPHTVAGFLSHSLMLSQIVGCMYILQNFRECLLVCDTECFNVVFHNEDKSCVCLSRNTKLWICMEYCGGGSLQDMYHGLYCIQISVKYSYCRSCITKTNFQY